MPEYLAPGAYVEEVGGRARAIEGVSTSVTGFVGPTRFGPVGGEPELLTSLADFSRVYGGIDRLAFEDSEYENYVAHAARAFFDNGGSRLYVTRIFEPRSGADRGIAGHTLDPPATLTLRARFPGQAGNMKIVFAAQTSPNLLSRDPTTNQAHVTGLQENDLVYVKPGPTSPPAEEGLYDVETLGGILVFGRSDGSQTTVGSLDPSPGADRVHRLTLSVRVRRSGRTEEEQGWDDLSPHPQARNALLSLFSQDPASRRQYLTVPFAIEGDVTSGAALAQALLGQDVLNKLSLYLSTDAELQATDPQPARRPAHTELGKAYTLETGNDGKLPGPDAYTGVKGSNLQPSTGLEAIAGVEEISIVAAPGHSKKGSSDDPARCSQIAGSLIAHCQERMRFRVTVLDPPDGLTVAEVQGYRQQFDSAHAALYYPWITIVDPLDPDGGHMIHVPPSGHVAGIYARTDASRGVFQAPANEVVIGAVGLETLVNKAQQDLLNPMGINCVRFFARRGYRLWGARTVSADPEWKYINVRRYFAYLEHSIDRGTQWVVFESNNETLWANVRRTVEDFLFSEWRNGALVGARSEEAFFVRCDRSTMTQNDLDNGRLVCLIGVAISRPAEFLIFRIGQWTADCRP